jgi:hypothetical protein
LRLELWEEPDEELVCGGGKLIREGNWESPRFSLGSVLGELFPEKEELTLVKSSGERENKKIRIAIRSRRFEAKDKVPQL